jgi:phloretin hydrolase
MAGGRELTAEEKEKSYSKYYYRAHAGASPELAPLLKGHKPMDPADALPIERMNDLLKSGYLPGETGYCTLPNGGAYVAVGHPMPGVTAEMVNWWFAWHGLEDLRYMLWSPEDHFAVSMTAEDRAKVLDPDRPLVLKFQGVTHHVYEDIGGGADDLWISFMTPEDFGFDMSRWRAPNVATLVAANVLIKANGAPEDAPMMPVAMCHFIRELPEAAAGAGGGVEFRTRFWMGWHIVDKKPHFALPTGAKVPEAVPAGLFEHCILEYSNLRVLLPEIYDEMRGVVA